LAPPNVLTVSDKIFSWVLVKPKSRSIIDMTLRVEGFAIISEDGMLADASGVMPSTLVIEADQKFLSNRLDRAAVISTAETRMRTRRNHHKGGG
jgi:hypothetical protein